ncbi:MULTISPECIES: peptide ABC transporter substrate-binding protein [Clostridia]|uniref:peptide ABC transporter substrate-binding protein n=1 Tax=Clostridia TaxID=186801 RepID=UPI000EA2BEEB|nr:MULTISPECIES: peptide ABC transporter substrate-binding protein [Clostridia]NBJ69661.1 peptide ABC transporter substrate-binding protein [Roseburia sp. 1XD42-34]RKI78285.1 peptide ABC transporter substrate-binding protein [Clostridium sp. 1xD42-85]
MKLNIFKKIGFFVLVILLLSACNFSESSDGDSSKKAGGEGKKVLNLSLENDIPDLNQVTTTDGISFDILNNVMEGLYRLDEDDAPQPAMAKSVDISEDKLTYTFHLRDGIKWSNGEAVTAHDFVYSWLRALHPDTSGSYSFIIADYIKGAEEYANGEGKQEDVAIKANDDKTLVVELNEPTPYFLGLTAFATYFPLNEKFINSVGDEFGLNHESILYNGPFVLTEYDQAMGVKMERNDHYWDTDNLKVDEVSMKVIKEKSTELNLYESGELDRITLSANDVNEFKDHEEFSTETEFTSWYLQFNLGKAPFDNKNIRKAFQLAYNPETLATNVLNNGSEPAYSLIPPEMQGVGDKSFRELAGEVIAPDYDQAKEYLEKGLDEIGGKLPEIEVLTADDTVAKDAATFIQSQIKENLNIDISIVTKPYSGRLDAMREDDYQFAISKWGADYNDAMTYLDLWVGDPIAPFRGNYHNPDYMNLVYQAKEEKDEQKRIDLLMKAERILLEEDSVLGPLYYQGSAYLQKPNIDNFVSHPYGARLDLKYVIVNE